MNKLDLKNIYLQNIKYIFKQDTENNEKIQTEFNERNYNWEGQHSSKRLNKIEKL